MMLLFFVTLNTLFCITYVRAQGATTTDKPYYDNRRIINGVEAKSDKNYMVYLKYARGSRDRWLCGGVIVHEEYIITSAACIEDVKHFYVVSGTFKYDEGKGDSCVKRAAKRAIWKCIPKNYAFNDRDPAIDWLNNDIAVVKVEDGFDFKRKVKGCDFVPRPLAYNNQSLSLEAPGTVCEIAGWGTKSRYGERNERNLLETRVEIISKARCTRRWGAMYTKIIENYMICTKDIGQVMSNICKDKYVECQDMSYSDYDEEGRRVQKSEQVPTNLYVTGGNDNRLNFWNGSKYDARRWGSTDAADGGFCENDHGGPIVYGCSKQEVVIGIMSACLVKARTEKCYGPFLYTSIYKNKEFVNCAIFKEAGPCTRQFRAGITYDAHDLGWEDFKEDDNSTAPTAKSKLLKQDTHKPPVPIQLSPAVPIQQAQEVYQAPKTVNPAIPIPLAGQVVGDQVAAAPAPTLNR